MKLRQKIWSGDRWMHKLWEAHDQAIFELPGYGFVLVPDHQPWAQEKVVCFNSFDSAFYCLMGEHWHPPMLP